MPRSIKRPSAALLCALALGPLGLSSSLAHDEGEHYRQQGAHLHGVGQLNVAVDGSALLIELISPAMDLVGFEHAPRNEAQRTAVAEARSRLERGDQLFAPSAVADCSLQSAEIELDLGATAGEDLAASQQDQDQDHGHQHEHEHEHADDPSHESHADVYASYVFECRQPSKLEGLTIGYLQAFPHAQKLQVQLVSETRQEALELTPDDQHLAF